MAEGADGVVRDLYCHGMGVGSVLFTMVGRGVEYGRRLVALFSMHDRNARRIAAAQHGFCILAYRLRKAESGTGGLWMP